MPKAAKNLFKFVAPFLVAPRNLLRRQLVRFAAIQATIHATIHRLIAVLRLLLAANAANLLTFRGVHPIMVFIAHIAAPTASAMMPLAGKRLFFLTNRTFLYALPLHGFKAVIPIALCATADAAASLPSMSQHLAPKAHIRLTPCWFTAFQSHMNYTKVGRQRQAQIYKIYWTGSRESISYDTIAHVSLSRMR